MSLVAVVHVAEMCRQCCQGPSTVSQVAKKRFIYVRGGVFSCGRPCRQNVPTVSPWAVDGVAGSQKKGSCMFLYVTLVAVVHVADTCRWCRQVPSTASQVTKKVSYMTKCQWWASSMSRKFVDGVVRGQKMFREKIMNVTHHHNMSRSAPFALLELMISLGGTRKDLCFDTKHELIR